MDVSPAALVHAVADMKRDQVTSEVQIQVLKKAQDIQSAGAMAMRSTNGSFEKKHFKARPTALGRVRTPPGAMVPPQAFAYTGGRSPAVR